jgi:hypothetical protein
MNDIDRLVQELYTADSPPPPERETLWAPVERRIGRPAGSRPIRRRRLQRRFALVFGVVLLCALVFALLPERHDPVGGSIPENASAAQVLRTLADRGSPLPDVPRGSFLYSKGTRTVVSTVGIPGRKLFSVFIREHWEYWVGRDGSQRDRIKTDPVPVGYPNPRDRRRARGYREPFGGPASDQITHSLKDFRRYNGISLTALRRLPSNPSALARVLLAISRAQHDTLAPNDPFRSALAIFLAPIRPATRAAMLRALASLPKVRRLPDEYLAGKKVVVIARRFYGYGDKRQPFDHVFLLDPATGELVGARYVTLSGYGSLPAGSATCRWTWRQAIVPTLRSRPAGW